jgi:tRNA(adenine34) deaminase
LNRFSLSWHSGEINARLASSFSKDLSGDAMDQPVTKPFAPEPEIHTLDLEMMERCIDLSRVAGTEGELPFAALITEKGKIIVEATNRVSRDGDITRHAELLALSKAQMILGKKTFRNCTLYSNVEPCAMCSFAIREARIGRVVFSFRSPIMGGFSRWNLLQDDGLSNSLPQVFGNPPEILAGMLADEAEKVWRDWNPFIWKMIKLRGCFVGSEGSCTYWRRAPRRLGPLRSFLTALFR